MTTRGYGMAVLLLLAMNPAGCAWLPHFATTKTQRSSVPKPKTSLTRLVPSNRDMDIARAWNHVGDDMNRNDRAAFQVLQELRASLQELEASIQQIDAARDPANLVARLAAREAREFDQRESRIHHAKEVGEGLLMQAKWDQAMPLPPPAPLPKPEILQAHDLYDEAAARLVAQLAAMEAMEFAQRESRINTAKRESEGVLLHAKWDLQKDLFPPKTPTKLAMPEILQAHDLLDADAVQLVAELAALDAMERNVKELIIDSARSSSESLTMHAKIDQQQTVPAVLKMEVPQVVIPQAHDMADAAAIKLVAELAALDAQELAFKVSLIDSARAASEGVTMNAKLDQQLNAAAVPKEPLQGLSPSAPDVPHHLFAAQPVMDDATRQLVAQLAAMDAAAFYARESLINTARDASEMITMHTKIDQQQAFPSEAKMVSEAVILQAHDLLDAEATRLVAELAALDANKLGFKETLIDSARAASEAFTMHAKIDQQQQFAMPTPSDTLVPPQVDDEAAHLVAQLATRDAAILTAKRDLIDTARDNSEFVTMEAKIDQQALLPTVPKEVPEILIPQAHDLLDEEASLLVAQLASKDAADLSAKTDRINAARDASEMITMQAKIDQQNTYITMALQLATEELARKKPVVNEQAQRIQAKLAILEAAKMAVLMDLAKSNAVESAAVTAIASASKSRALNEQEKHLKTISAILEAERFAIQVDNAKSDAIKDAAKLDATTRAATRPLSTVVEVQVAVAQIIEPVILAAEKITEALIREETIVEAFAEPVLSAGQNPNQLLEIIDVEALKSAAQGVKEASDMLTSDFADSPDKEVIIQAAKETAEAVLREVQTQQGRLADKEAVEGIRGLNNLSDGPSLADLTNNGFSEKKVKEVNVQRIRPLQMLEPLPQDVRDHQEDAARFYYAKKAAQEIAKNKSPEGYFFAKRASPAPRDLSAAELAAMEREEVDRELRELFVDVGLGFNDVKQSLSRLLNSDFAGNGNNSTQFSP